MTDESSQATPIESNSGQISELTFLGPSNDGNRLLLAAPDGSRFELPVDSRLIAVVSREYRERVASPARPPAELPTPREIQDRIRHGENVEDLANSVGAELEDISRFARPVITERAHVAELAQQTLVPTGTGHRPLVDAVMDRLRVRGIDVSATLWDAWRRQDGQWAVVVAYPVSHGSQVATFIYSPHDKSVDPSDDEARWLLEVPAPPVATPPPPAAAPAPDAKPQESSRRAEPNGKPNWDRAHPAARAAQRRESAPSPVSAAPSPAPEGRDSALSSVKAPEPAETKAPEPVAKKSAEAEPPQWEELLFGTPRDDK